jgi:hypothetical protein
LLIFSRTPNKRACITASLSITGGLPLKKASFNMDVIFCLILSGMDDFAGVIILTALWDSTDALRCIFLFCIYE